MSLLRHLVPTLAVFASLTSSACGEDSPAGGTRDAGGLDAEADASGDAEAASEAGRDAGDDADVAETGSPDPCEAEAEAIRAYAASHGSCASNADCVAVGDCSASDFFAVRTEHEDEAFELLYSGTCHSQDGPGYHAVCSQGQCVAVETSVWCGAPTDTACPTGMVREEAGCGTVRPTWEDGCHVPCDGDSSVCAPGYSCQATSVLPACAANPPTGEVICLACGTQVERCLPEPECDVRLEVAFTGHRASTELVDGTRLSLIVENLTDEPQTFEAELPCHGPRVDGLGDYDIWESCLAGACESPTHSEPLELAAGERRTLRSALLSRLPTSCNPEGLAPATYAVSFGFESVTGVEVCGPDASELRVEAP